MKDILLVLLLISGFSNAWALCYDGALSDKAIFENCSIAAKQGDADSQFALGDMYYSGTSVVMQDYKQAVVWYKKGAEQGHAHTQYALGYMYYSGYGVTQDYVMAHMWWNISAASGMGGVASSLRDDVAKQMTSSQIEKAQDLAREWMAQHE